MQGVQKILVQKMEIYGHNQNIGLPERFFLCDIEYFRNLFLNIDKPS